MKFTRNKHYPNGRAIGINLYYGSSLMFPTERHWHIVIHLWDRGWSIYFDPSKRESERAQSYVK